VAQDSLVRDPALTFMGGGEVEFIPKIPLPEIAPGWAT